MGFLPAELCIVTGISVRYRRSPLRGMPIPLDIL